MHNIPLKLLTLFVFILSSLEITAQRSPDFGFGLPKKKNVEIIKSRKVIVLIEEPRKFVLKNLEDPAYGTLEGYKAAIDRYNVDMKTAMEKFWPYNNGPIEYKTLDEISALKKTKTKDYIIVATVTAYFYGPVLTSSGWSEYVKYQHGLGWFLKLEGISSTYTDYHSEIVVFPIENWDFKAIGDMGTLPLIQFTLFDIFPTAASLAFAIDDIQFWVTLTLDESHQKLKRKEAEDKLKADRARRAGELPQKTLLIRKDWIVKDLSSNFEKYYPYPVEVCDKATFAAAYLRKDSTYNYGIVMPSRRTGAQMLIINSSDHWEAFAGYSAEKEPDEFTEIVVQQIVEQIRKANH